VKTVGIRELKNRLSEHLREVRRGEHLLITDRGEVIGELSPPGQRITEASVPIGVLALARRGMLTLGNPGDPNAYPVLPRLRRGKHDSASMLDAERGRRWIYMQSQARYWLGSSMKQRRRKSGND
jgi:antitoxin (DNA-binding transcriptional repressor) of toxin-antitoxin stability system